MRNQDCKSGVIHRLFTGYSQETDVTFRVRFEIPKELRLNDHQSGILGAIIQSAMTVPELQRAGVTQHGRALDRLRLRGLVVCQGVQDREARRTKPAFLYKASGLGILAWQLHVGLIWCSQCRKYIDIDQHARHALEGRAPRRDPGGSRGGPKH